MSEAANERGNRLRREGKFDEAHRAYTMAIEKNEYNTHAWCNIGLLYAMKNENEKAEKCFRMALEIDPDDGYVWHLVYALSAHIHNNNLFETSHPTP